MDTKPTYALLLPSLVGILFTGALADEVPFPVAPLAKDNYLLIDKAGIDAAKRKAETQPWAKAALDAVLTRASGDVNRSVTLPPRGGQWPHWYSCKKDGGRLVADSPTSHRCRVCGAVYHGDPYDAVVFYGEHSRWAQTVRNLGLAYRFTGRREYAQKAGEILVAYADRYAGYPPHDIHGNARVGGGRIMAQTLDESVWLIPVAFGYALVRETMSDAARAHVEKDLLVAAADVIRSHRMGIHNIQCWKNSAVGLAGLAANNEALVREAIEDLPRGFRAQVAKGITDDGLWYEGSMGYDRIHGRRPGTKPGGSRPPGHRPPSRQGGGLRLPARVRREIVPVAAGLPGYLHAASLFPIRHDGGGAADIRLDGGQSGRGGETGGGRRRWHYDRPARLAARATEVNFCTRCQI